MDITTYYQKIANQQIDTGSTPSMQVPNGSKVMDHYLSVANQLQRNADYKQAKDQASIDRYNKQEEKLAEQNKKLNTLNIMTTYTKGLEQLQQLDLSDPEQRKEYKEQYQELLSKRNKLLQSSGSEDIALKATLNTPAELKSTFVSKVTNDTLAKYVNKFSELNSNLGPNEAWNVMEQEYTNDIKSASTPEEKLGLMSAYLKLKQTTSDDEVYTKTRALDEYNKKVNETVNDALKQLQNQGIDINKVYTDPVEYRRAQQLLHDYAIKQGWDTTTEKRANDYLKYTASPKENKSKINTSDLPNYIAQYIIQKPASETEYTNYTKNTINVKSDPESKEEQTINALDTKKAINNLIPQHMLKQYHMDRYLSKNISPADFLAQELNDVKPGEIEKYLDKDGHIKQGSDIPQRIYNIYETYKDAYDLATGNRVFLVPETQLINKNDGLGSQSKDYLTINGVKVPKDKLKTVDVNGVPTYYVTSKDLYKYAKNNNIENTKSITTTHTYNYTINLPKKDVVTPDNINTASALTLTQTYTNKKNARLINKTFKKDGSLNFKNPVVTKYYELYKNTYVELPKTKFEDMTKNMFENAVYVGKAAANLRSFNNIKGVIVRLGDSNPADPSTATFNINAKNIFSNKKNIVDFLNSSATLIGLKSGDSTYMEKFKDHKVQAYLKNNKNLKTFYHNFLLNLENGLPGCKNIDGTGRCTTNYEGIVDLVKTIDKTLNQVILNNK